MYIISPLSTRKSIEIAGAGMVGCYASQLGQFVQVFITLVAWPIQVSIALFKFLFRRNNGGRLTLPGLTTTINDSKVSKMASHHYPHASSN